MHPRGEEASTDTVRCFVSPFFFSSHKTLTSRTITRRSQLNILDINEIWWLRIYLYHGDYFSLHFITETCFVWLSAVQCYYCNRNYDVCASRRKYFPDIVTIKSVAVRAKNNTSIHISYRYCDFSRIMLRWYDFVRFQLHFVKYAFSINLWILLKEYHHTFTTENKIMQCFISTLT